MTFFLAFLFIFISASAFTVAMLTQAKILDRTRKGGPPQMERAALYLVTLTLAIWCLYLAANLLWPLS